MENINFEQTKALLHDSNFYYIICTDNDGNYSYINSRYAKNFGHIDSDLVGKPYYITMHPDDRKICEEAGGKCYEHPEKLFPAIIRKHDGKGGYIVTQWEFSLIMENGIPQGVFCLGFDITEYVRVKSTVESVNQDLKVKNELLNNIAYEQSHIVRAPLANIMGLVNLLKNMDLGANLAAIITMLDESSNNLDGVIKGIINKTNL